MRSFSGLLNRLFLCSLAGTLLLLLLNIKNFDLHFTLRGAQKVSSDIVIAHLPPEITEIQEAIFEIEKNRPKLIVAPVSRKLSRLLSEMGQVVLIPRKSLKPDSDGMMRSLNVPNTLNAKIQQVLKFDSVKNVSFINFRGPANTFPSVYFYEIKNQKVLPSVMANKIVILNIQDPEDEPLATPVGDLSPAELLANMIDNMQLQRWITPLPLWISIIFVILISLAVAALILSLSANLAFLGIFILWLLISSFGFLMFDQFYIWIPLTAYISHIFVSYFVFISYKLNKKEQQAWRLEKDRAYQIEMDEMKKNFLNLFSHDLKTPIAKILGQIEIMDGLPGSNEKMKEGFGKIRRYSNELNQYVKNILKISQIEANRFQLKLEPCDINSIIKNAVQIIKPLADEKSITIEEHLEPLFSINCDKELVQQIILNIMENAVKYSFDNTKINVLSTEEDDFVVISIKDQGKGIRVEDQDMIWKKFSRFDEQAEGTGLGLYLVKYFVEAHNGFVFIESQVGEGSTVGFKLPIA